MKTTRAAGVTTEVLIGALDQQMMDACAKHDVPCILIDGGEITKQLAERKSGNVRNDAAIYPKMSVLKVLGLAPGLGAGIGLRVSLLTRR